MKTLKRRKTTHSAGKAESKAKQNAPADAVEHAHAERRPEQEDPLDIALEETFPASDPLAKY